MTNQSDEVTRHSHEWADRRNKAKHHIRDTKSRLNSIRSCGVLTYKELRTLGAIEKRLADFLKLWKHRNTESKNKYLGRHVGKPGSDMKRIEEDDPMHDFNL